jgi:uncharacterized delta-60 repeat protein
MKKLFSSAAVIAFALVACQTSPAPVQENSNYRLLGSLELSLGDNGVQRSKFTPSRLALQGDLVSDSSLVFTASAFSIAKQVTPLARFLNAKYTVQNNSGASISNLTLVAYHKTGNEHATALKSIYNFNNVGQPVTATYAQSIKPSHGMIGNGTVGLSSNNEDMMLLTEPEVSVLTTSAGTALQSGEYLLPYGYVARNSTTLTSRTIANNGSGLVNLAFRTDGSNEGSDTAYRFTVTALVFDNPSNTTRVAESLEEQSATQVNTRKNNISATQIIATHDSPIMSITDANQVNVCRVRTAGTASSPLAYLSSTAIPSSAGALDPCFGANGKRRAEVSSNSTDFPAAMTRDSKGRFVVAGWRSITAVERIWVMRFNQDGSVDATFGTGGSVSLTTTDKEVATAVAVDASDNIYVGGTQRPQLTVPNTFGPREFLVMKLSSTGTLVSGFGTSGRFTTSINTAGLDDFLTTIKLDSSNRIVAGGSMSQSGGLSDSALIRLTTAGALDTTFSGDGIFTFDMNFSDIDGIIDLTFDSSGKIVSAGTTYVSAFATNFGVARVTTAGVLDTTFSGDGRATVNFASADLPNNVAVDSSGKILVTGISTAGTNNYVATRINSDGNSLDTTFGTGAIPNGKATVPMTDFAVSTALQVDSSGRILISGGNNATGSVADFAAIRLSANGVLDTTFGTSGKAIVPIGASNDVARGSALDNNGNLVLVGEVQLPSSTFDIGLIRLQNP